MPRILIVEDDSGQLEMRRQILEHAGYEIATAETAEEALQKLPGCQLIVMDLQIPEPEDGIRLIEAAKGAARIIVLSGAAPEARLDVDEFLGKPCSSRRLLEAIAKWISASK